MATSANTPLAFRRLGTALLFAPVLAIVAIVLLAFGAALMRRSGGETAFAINNVGGPGSLSNSVAHDFSLPLYDGSDLRIADLRGRGVVLNFWASWCVPCRDEAPILARAAREYEQEGVTFLGVGVWDAEVDARAFVSRYGIGYPSGADLGGRIAIDYGLAGVPETFFVRPDGTLSRRWMGPIGESALRNFVEEIKPSR